MFAIRSYQTAKSWLGKSTLTAAVLFALTALLAACGGGPEATPTAAPRATPTTGPGAAATATPTQGPDAAALAEAYFRDKTLNFTVGYAPGGGFDTFARIMAQHLPRHVPGGPGVIVSNMPGGDSLVAARSSLTRPITGRSIPIAVFNKGVIIRSVVLGEDIEFDITSPLYLGLPDNAPTKTNFCSRTAVANSLDAFRNSPTPLKAGETGPSVNPAPLVAFTREVGMPVDIIYGYGGTSEIRVAFDRGELDLTTRCGDVDIPGFPHWFDDNFATPLFYWQDVPPFMEPLLAEGKYPWYKRFDEVVNLTGVQREAYELYFSLNGSRVFATSPTIPDYAGAALIAAFRDVTADPAFIADMEARAYDVGLLTGDELQAAIQRIVDAPKDVSDFFKVIHGVQP